MVREQFNVPEDSAGKGKILVLPLPYFVYPRERFVRAANAAIKVARALPECVVLLTAPLQQFKSRYGAIRVGPERGWISEYCVRSVEGLAGLAAGGEGERLRTSLLVAARVETLSKIGFPGLIRRYDHRARHRELPLANHNRTRRTASMKLVKHLIQHCLPRVLAVEMNDVVWSDSRGLRRIAATIQRVRRASAA